MALERGAADATRGTRSERGGKESGSKWEPLWDKGVENAWSSLRGGGRTGEVRQLSETSALP